MQRRLTTQQKSRMEHALFACYLVVAALWLGYRAQFGLSPLDVGMYMSGYEHFNADPMTLSYLGQWQLTYQLTGWICSLFGIDTFYGLRLLRVALIVVLQIILWLYLNKRMSRTALLVGLMLSTLSQYGAYHEINYNDWSAFWLVLAVLAYHKGVAASPPAPLQGERGAVTYRHATLWIALSGFILGVNIFFRVVNVAFLLLPFVGWVVAWSFSRLGTRMSSSAIGGDVSHVAMASNVRHVVSFFSGAAVGVSFVVVLSWLTGTLPVLKLTLNDILAIGGTNTDSHGLNIVLRNYLDTFVAISKVGLVCMAIVLGGRYLVVESLEWCRRRFGSKNLWETAGTIVLLVALCFLLNVGSNTTDPNRHQLLAVGFCLVPIGIRAFFPRLLFTRQMELLYQLSLFVMLILPLGSNASVEFIYPVMTLLALPLTMNTIHLTMLQERLAERKRGDDGSSLRPSLWWAGIVGVLMVMLFVNVMSRSEMEDVESSKATFAINSPKAAHITTSKENAALHNTLIEQLKWRIPRGSCLVTNVSLPLISMLDCRPYAVFSDLFSSDAMNDRYLKRAYKKPPTSLGTRTVSPSLPYILVSEVNLRPGFQHVIEWLQQRGNYDYAWETTVSIPVSSVSTATGKVYLLAPKPQ